MTDLDRHADVARQLQLGAQHAVVDRPALQADPILRRCDLRFLALFRHDGRAVATIGREFGDAAFSDFDFFVGKRRYGRLAQRRRRARGRRSPGLPTALSICELS